MIHLILSRREEPAGHYLAVNHSLDMTHYPTAMEAEENEEIKSSCRTTKTILHGDPFIKDYIYKLVTATSELEARGNLIFTYAVLRCNEEERSVHSGQNVQSELHDGLYPHSRSPSGVDRQSSWI